MACLKPSLCIVLFPCLHNNPRYASISSAWNFKFSSKALWLTPRVQLENEFAFAKSFSEIVAKRFSRVESAVALSIDHSCCMIVGGTFQGAYLLTITSPVSISPACNKRNVALLSEWLEEHIGVPPPRGYILFRDPEPANFAPGGQTTLDLLEKELPNRSNAPSRQSIRKSRNGRKNRAASPPPIERTGSLPTLERPPPIPRYSSPLHSKPKRPQTADVRRDAVNRYTSSQQSPASSLPSDLRTLDPMGGLELGGISRPAKKKGFLASMFSRSR